MQNVFQSLPMPVILALIGVVLGMLVLAHALAGLHKQAVVRKQAERKPRLRLVSGSGRYEDDDGD